MSDDHSELNAPQEEEQSYPLPWKQWVVWSISGAVMGVGYGAFLAARHGLWGTVVKTLAYAFLGAVVMGNWWNIHNRKIW
jgi:hypothetical protein